MLVCNKLAKRKDTSYVTKCNYIFFFAKLNWNKISKNEKEGLKLKQETQSRNGLDVPQAHWSQTQIVGHIVGVPMLSNQEKNMISPRPLNDRVGGL